MTQHRTDRELAIIAQDAKQIVSILPRQVRSKDLRDYVIAQLLMGVSAMSVRQNALQRAQDELHCKWMEESSTRARQIEALDQKIERLRHEGCDAHRHSPNRLFDIVFAICLVLGVVTCCTMLLKTVQPQVVHMEESKK